MADTDIHRRIEALVAEEQALWQQEADTPGALHTPERTRLEELRVTLDQCWDLLRQRRALREFGLDSDAARLRDPGTVEQYRQ